MNLKIAPNRAVLKSFIEDADSISIVIVSARKVKRIKIDSITFDEDGELCLVSNPTMRSWG